MPPQVLALKWRPQIFEDMVGQEHVSRTLQNAFTANRLAHAYIFAGPRGVGKTTTARIFAKLLNCRNPKGAEPCNECDMCVEVNQGSSLDVIEIDAASVNGVDGIRALQEQIGTYPAKGKYKVYIFDEAHRITKAAFDAFLKTLEEPPAHVVFVLASTEIHMFPPTVQSRCQRLEFRAMGLDTLTKQLRRISDAEKIEADDKVLREVARTAGGSMRDAQRTLDQLVAFAGNKIVLEDVRRVLGLVEGERYVALARAAFEEDAPAAIDLVRGIVDSGKDLDQFYRGLLETYRHMLVAKAYPSKMADLLPLPSEEASALYEIAQNAEDAYLLSALRLLLEQEWAMRHSAVPSVVLETVVIELCRLKGLVEVTDALASAESGRSLAPRPSLKPAAPAAYRAAPAPTSAPKAEVVYKPIAVSKLPPAEVGEPVLAVSEIEEPSDSNEDPRLTALKQQWREVLEKVGVLKKALQGILTDCRPKSVDRDTLVVVCKGPFHQEQILLPENKRLVEQVITEIAKTPLKLVAVLPDHMTPTIKTESGVVKPHAHPKVDVQALQKDEPLVKAVMEMFDGKVVDVIRTKGPTA
jgi:DNA polymerase-3 subunit gamma/tau